MTGNKPMVSVCIVTYNHEKWIAQAIESALMQKTNFPFKIVIGEDCSTDKTREIVKRYAEQYPDKIKALLHPKNLGPPHNPGRNNFLSILKQYSNKYIAMLEGDDYWTDPYKLQKQVDFLEAHSEYGLVHSDCHFYFQTNGKWKYNANRSLVNSKNLLTKEDLFNVLIEGNYKIRTATAIFRKELLRQINPNTEKFSMGDTQMWLDFSQLCKFYYIDEVHAVYRITNESASRSKNKVRNLHFRLSMAEMRVYYSQKYGYPISPHLKSRYNKALLTYKLYDPSFQALFPLISPSSMVTFVYRTMEDSASIRVLYRWLFKLQSFIKTVKNKIQTLCDS